MKLEQQKKNWNWLSRTESASYLNQFTKNPPVTSHRRNHNEHHKMSNMWYTNKGTNCEDRDRKQSTPAMYLLWANISCNSKT